MIDSSFYKLCNIKQYRTILVAGILVIFPVFALATEDLTANKYKQIPAVRAEIAPVIDGVLDDPAWKQAFVIKDLHQARPHEYTKPNNRSEFYVIYDKDAVYIGAHLWDSEPDKITANILKQGASVRNDDRITIVIDPFNDKRSGYGFSLNSNSVRRDGSYINPLSLAG